LTNIVFKDYNQVINIRYLHIYITVVHWQGRGVGHGSICGILYFKLNGIEAIKKSPNLKLFSDRTSST